MEKKLIRREKLFARHQEQEYRSFWWQPKNQTYYYSINYEELEKLIKKAEAIETIRIENLTELSIEVSKETKFCELSQNRTKNTNYKKVTTKQDLDDRYNQKPNSIAAVLVRVPLRLSATRGRTAASPKTALEEEKTPKQGYSHSDQLTAVPSQKKVKSEENKSNPSEEKRDGGVDYIVNKRYKELLRLLDSTGIPINRTIRDLLKLYSSESESSFSAERSHVR